jgi:hypothetical protein
MNTTGGCFRGLYVLLFQLVLFIAPSVHAQYTDSLSLTVLSSHELSVADSSGKEIARLRPTPIRQPVNLLADRNLKISYGYDAQYRLSAILYADFAAPQQQRFVVLGQPFTLVPEGLFMLTWSKDLRAVQIEQLLPLPSGSGILTGRQQAREKVSRRFSVIPSWMEPVTPPPPFKLADMPQEEARLVEVRGTVLALPDLKARTALKAVENTVLPPSLLLQTGPDGCAAVLLGNVNSVRLAPNSEGSVAQKFSGSVRETVVTLNRGMAFLRVGTRQGEIQNFSVKTPYGSAVAKGTNFAVIVDDGKMTVCSASGRVALLSPNGTETGSVFAKLGQQIDVKSSAGQMSTAEAKAAVARLVDISNEFNDKVVPLLQRLAVGGKLTAEEKEYLRQTPQITPEGGTHQFGPANGNTAP